jgi:hypothetical protein
MTKLIFGLLLLVGATAVGQSPFDGTWVSMALPVTGSMPSRYLAEDGNIEL